MTNFRKAITATITAVSLGGAALAATSSPAAAWGGYGWHGGWGGPVAAGVVGGLALGAVAAGASGYGYGYGYGCVGRVPMYDGFGNFVGYRRIRTAC